jgi:ferredoxin-NADP reductase
LARIVERRVEAKNTVTLVLKTNKHFQGFAAGQHVNVTVNVNGARLTRSYSLSDVPRADGLLAITVKNVDGGKVSTQLCQRTEVGDTVELSQVFGEMTITTPDRPYLLLAAGSGITPLMSLIRQLTAGRMNHHVTLVYWAKTRAEFCFLQELKAIADHEPRFHLHLALTAETVLLSTELQGRPTATLFNSIIANLSEQRVLACGSAGFVDSVRGLLTAEVVSFQAEAFTPPVINENASLGTVRVELKASQKVLELSAGQSLLSALEAQGIQPSSGCRMGICNTCVCPKLSGTTQNLQTGELEAEPQTALKLCVSRAHSDLILDL